MLLKNVCTGIQYWLLFASLSIFVLLPAYAAKPLIFNSTGQPPLNTLRQDGFLDAVCIMALNRIGLRIDIRKIPAERGLRNANTGLIDGEMSRIKGISRIYPNLVRVPEKVMEWEFVVFSRKPFDTSSGWKSLSGIRVGYITGWKILEKNVPSDAIVTRVRDSSQLFRLLDRGRVDVVIYERWGGKLLIRNQRLQGISTRWPALAKRNMYMYVHKKHQSVVKKLSNTLAEMKKDGSYKKLFDRHLGSLVK